MILEKLRACWGFSPTVHRNVALFEGFLKGKSFADLAQENGLSKSRVRQIIDKADRLVGGGILTKAESSKASPRSKHSGGFVGDFAKSVFGTFHSVYLSVSVASLGLVLLTLSLKREGVNSIAGIPPR